VKPETVGDHVRMRRLSLKLLQKDVAQKLGVDTTTIHNWETSATQPGFAHLPAIVEFLGYNPLPPAKNWAERLVRGRTVLGLSQNAFARKLDVDPSTLARWERGEREPNGVVATRAERVLSAANDTPALRAS
jgi:transcriptional regulator with XRE-family HTH domain